MKKNIGMLVGLLLIMVLVACVSSQNSSLSSKNNSTSSSKVSEQSKPKNKTDATKKSTVDSSKKSESSEKEQNSAASSQSSSDSQTSPTQGGESGEVKPSERGEGNPPTDSSVAAELLIEKGVQGSQVQAVGGQKVRLNVSLVIQRYWNYCAPATVSMMLVSRGINVDQAQLANEMGTDESFGTHNSNAIRVLNRYMFGYDVPYGNQAGYRLATVTNPNSGSEDMKLFKKRLVQNINDGYPMYYTFDNSKMYPGRSGEHNVIGVGYVLTADGTDVAYVYYLDPSYMVQDPIYGGLKIVSPEELLNAMVTCMEPNYGW